MSKTQTVRSPSTGSQPDLTVHQDTDFPSISGITLRKRKTPESPVNEITEFRTEFNDGLRSYRQDMQSMLSQFKQEITASFKDMMREQSTDFTGLREEFSEVKKQLSGFEQTTIKFSQECANIKSDVTKLLNLDVETKTKLSSLEKDLSDARVNINSLSDQLRMKEQQGRLNNLEISGVTFKKGENLYNILNTIASKVNFSLSPSDVDYIHRVRRYPHQNLATNDASKLSSDIPNIIVRFTQRKRKNDLLAAVRSRRGLSTADLDVDGPSRPVFVNDHLAPQNKQLYSQARKIGREMGYKYIWLSDCKIFLRKTDNSKVLHISCVDDISKIK